MSENEEGVQLRRQSRRRFINVVSSVSEEKKRKRSADDENDAVEKKELNGIAKKAKSSVGDEKSNDKEEKNAEKNEKEQDSEDRVETKVTMRITTLENGDKIEFSIVAERANCCFICTRRFSHVQRDDANDDAEEGKVSEAKSVKAEGLEKGQQIVEFHPKTLDKLCFSQRHKPWNESTQRDLLADFTSKHVDSEEMQNRMQNRVLASFRRICVDCFERSILFHICERPSTLPTSDFGHVFGETVPHSVLKFPCPLCPSSIVHDVNATYIRSDRLSGALSEPTRVLYEAALQRELLKRNTLFLNCPVPNCAYSIAIEKRLDVEQLEIPDMLTCAEHGSYCTRCWNAVGFEQRMHNCKGVPKEVSRFASNLRRCTHCRTAIEKNGGCTNVRCQCGFLFQWQLAETATGQRINLQQQDEEANAREEEEEEEEEQRKEAKAEETESSVSEK